MLSEGRCKETAKVSASEEPAKEI